LVLTVAASLLLWVYGASVDSLIHLYVIGVFTAFTLSQAGMVRYWLRRRGRGWQRSAAINAVGATATGLVDVVVIVTKFAQGAWLVIVAIPLLVLGFYGVHRHYRRVGRRLRAGIDAVRAASPRTTNTTVVVVESLDEAVDEAVWYAGQIAEGNGFRAIHVPGPRTDSGIRARWFDRVGDRPRLEVLGSDTGRVDTAMEYVWTLPRGEAEFVTVVIPELFRRPSLAEEARRRLQLSLKLRLLYESGVAIADVPVVAGAAGTPERLAARVFVSDVHAATVRALNYARTLGLRDTRAVFFAFGAEEAERMKRDWLGVGLQTPLEIVEAPFRDIGSPLLAYLRRLTADPDVAVAAVMPEIVVRGWSRLLHNQRALYVKRLLLFEPRVILTSVPYQLFR
jgi:hypothetical protein